MKILIIDDELLIRRSLASLAKHKGHTVQTAGDSNQAIKKWLSSRPDLVFLDFLIPKINGLSVLKQVGKKNEKVVLISARPFSSIKENNSNYTEIDLFISKPFDNIIEVFDRAEALYPAYETVTLP